MSDSDPNSSFEKFAARFGGAAPQNAVPNVLRVVYHFKDIIAKRPGNYDRDGKPFSLQVGYVFDNSFNARAGRQGNDYVIGVNVGIPFTLIQIMGALLSQERTFAEIGDQSSDTPYRFPGRFEVQPLASGMVQTPQPTDPARQILAIYLASIAEMLIVTHEFGHIVNGHVDLLRNSFGLNVVDELDMAGQSSLRGIDVQTLEFDADAAAVSETLKLVTNASLVKLPDGRVHQKFPETNMHGTLHDAVRRFGFAAYVCYRIFAKADVSDDIDRILEASHPPGAIRITWIAQTVEGLLAIQGGLNPAEYAADLATGISEAEFAWSATFGEPVINLFTEEIWTISRALRNRIGERWKTMRSELEPYNRGGRLAPAEDVLWPFPKTT